MSWEFGGVAKHIQRTRKPHLCFGCGQSIPVGSAARLRDGKYDGQFVSDYFCVPCNDFVIEHPEDFVDGIWFGDVGSVRRDKEQETVEVENYDCGYKFAPFISRRDVVPVRVEVGTIWRCIDERSEYNGRLCAVKEIHDHPDYNGDGEIELLYADGTRYVGKVRRFTPGYTHQFVGRTQFRVTRK